MDRFGNPTESDNIWQAVRDWWIIKAASEIDPLISKAIEYGGAERASDLVEIGRTMAASGVITPPGLTPEQEEAHYAELGMYFYLVGKMARWTAAISEGRRASDDTLLDIGVYVRMCQRVREAGGWPV
jgi:hypothetical protein